MKAAWIGVVGVTVAVLGGCMMGPDYRRPDLPVPETYRFPCRRLTPAGGKVSVIRY